MRFRLFGAEVHLSFLFCAAVCAVICTDKTGIVIPAFIAAAVHEAGHLFALWLYDCPPVKIDLVPAAVKITRRGISPKENAVVTALAGPLINAVFAFCAGLNYYLYNKPFMLYFAAANAALGIINLLPAAGLDGGTALFSVIERRVSHKAALVTVRFVSLFLGVAAAAAGVYLYLKGRLNISVFTLALYLLFCGLCTSRA